MTEDDKQAVAGGEADDLSSDDTVDARNDEPSLEQLLDAIEAQEDDTPAPEPKASKPEPKEDDGLAARLEKLERERQEDQQASLARDIEAGMKETVGSFLENETIKKVYDHDEVEGLINVEATKNPKISTAFGMRHSQPGEWRKIERALMKKIEDRAAGKIGQSLGQQEAADDAARGVSNQPPDASEKVPVQSDLSAMSDADLRALKQGLDADFG